MITAIEIENFKGIGPPIRIEFKPITLLFGPNSAGKSTIFDAINLVKACLNRRDSDIDELKNEHPSYRMGGFRNFVHRHEASKEIKITLEFTCIDELKYSLKRFLKLDQESKQELILGKNLTIVDKDDLAIFENLLEYKLTKHFFQVSLTEKSLNFSHGFIFETTDANLRSLVTSVIIEPQGQRI